MVGPESGVVAAPPESECSLKLPSGEVMVHDSTPLVFQKIEARAPKGTFEGTAQISTFGSTAGGADASVEVAPVPLGTLFFTGATTGSAGGGNPT